jgi:hypothetical protein
MDDWVILAPTRWKLRAAIRLVNETLAELKLEQHPGKTFIGRVCRGFDLLGYLFTPAGLEVAPRAVEHCVERVFRLYEHGADLVHIGAYVRRWLCWARSGMRTLREELFLRALELITRSLGLAGRAHRSLPALCTAAPAPSVHEAAGYRDRCQGGR